MTPKIPWRCRVGWMLATCVGAAVLWVVFRAYQQPGLLLEFMNLRYCG
jgi:hypothetical protein